jgi:hypothetical protein
VPPDWKALPVASAPLFRGFRDWSVTSAIEMMDRQGIAAAVLSMALFGFEDPAGALRRGQPAAIGIPHLFGIAHRAPGGQTQ